MGKATRRRNGGVVEEDSVTNEERDIRDLLIMCKLLNTRLRVLSGRVRRLENASWAIRLNDLIKRVWK
jgi:hypothetical protein